MCHLVSLAPAQSVSNTCRKGKTDLQLLRLAVGCPQYSGVCGCSCISDLILFAPARAEGPCSLLLFNGWKARSSQAGHPHCTCHLFSGVQKEVPSSPHFCLSLQPACSCLHPVSSQTFTLPSNSTSETQHTIQQTSKLPSFRERQQGLEAGGVSFPYLAQCPGGRWGTWDSAGAHAGRKLAMSFCSSPSSQLEKSHPGHIRVSVLQITATERLRQDELTRKWPNGLTLCKLLAQALQCGFLSPARPLLDKSCEKLMKLFCSAPSSFSRSVCLAGSGWAGRLLT